MQVLHRHDQLGACASRAGLRLGSPRACPSRRSHSSSQLVPFPKPQLYAAANTQLGHPSLVLYSSLIKVVRVGQPHPTPRSHARSAHRPAPRARPNLAVVGRVLPSPSRRSHRSRHVGLHLVHLVRYRARQSLVSPCVYRTRTGEWTHEEQGCRSPRYRRRDTRPGEQSTPLRRSAQSRAGCALDGGAGARRGCRA